MSNQAATKQATETAATPLMSEAEVLELVGRFIDQDNDYAAKAFIQWMNYINNIARADRMLVEGACLDAKKAAYFQTLHFDQMVDRFADGSVPAIQGEED